MTLDLKQKVVAYITRPSPGGSGEELLVFEHRDFPEAGVQVPAGSVEPGESPEQAVLREVAEESGLKDLRFVAKVGESDEVHWGSHRHYFHLAVEGPAPEQWEHVTGDFHDDEHRRAGKPLVFSFRWVRLMKGIVLAGHQHRLLPKLLTG